MVYDGSFQTSLRSPSSSFLFILEIKSFFLGSKPVFPLLYFKPMLTFYFIHYWATYKWIITFLAKEKGGNNFRPSSHSVKFVYNLDMETFRDPKMLCLIWQMERLAQGHSRVLSRESSEIGTEPGLLSEGASLPFHAGLVIMPSPDHPNPLQCVVATHREILSEQSLHSGMQRGAYF